ncbi:MAG: tRNA (5-methylaminomethyl-2-thiouridine)(34)-methyltransferase MnmD [Salinivirgaceae bacterium]|nr:tRNA (5-methylaminomethyl-2-thiouridine)(34)-methyltransferase MnmD [Salinivirgaceae bacterium]
MHTIKPIITADGSSSLFVPELNEHYHSTNGALQESRHIFIDHGMHYFHKNNPEIDTIHIFEMGFGTGLNALLAWEFSQKENLKIHYTTIEKYPVENRVIQELNFGKILTTANAKETFETLHTAPWNQEYRIDNFTLKKIEGDMLNYNPPKPIDVVFFDAFAPDLMPQLWSVDVFSKLFNCMNFNSVLTTYSAKGDVRRNLITAGFTVKKLAGPPGKRHMLHATCSTL